MNEGRRWREEPISRTHDRQPFDCGVRELNLFLQQYARQSHQSGGAKTFVAVVPDEPRRVLGYYSLSPGAIAFARVPAAARRRLARHEVPVFRLARLAVDLSVQGRGVGGQLLWAACKRALAVAVEVGGVGIAIDAKDQRAADWYASFGALPLIDEPQRLILPLSTVARVIDRAPDAH